MKGALPLTLVAAALLCAAPARAQGTDLAAAQGLFDEAKQLVAKGKFAEACPKFFSSFKFDPKPGTAVNLADCYEKNGQIASAWARYLEAASLAQRAGQPDREKYAKEHAATLEPKVSRLTITAASPPRGLEVLRAGTVVDAALIGTAVPVDPGKYLIEARAPGKKPWSKTVEVGDDAARAAVEIPSLEDVPVTPAGPDRGPAPPPGPPPSSSPQRPIAFAAIAVGGVGLIVGGITGGLAISKHASLASTCTQGVCLNQDSAIASYHLLGTLSDVGLVVGGALAATGIVLLVTAPKATASKQAWVTPVVGPGFAGARGSF